VWQIALVIFIVIVLALFPKKEIDLVEIIDDSEEDLHEFEEWILIEEEEAY